MRSSLREAIIKTIAYGDIFQYPLQAEEVFNRLIGVHSTQSAVRRELKKTKEIEETNGYFFLKGRSALVDLRKKRRVCSERKWHAAQRAADVLFYIPTVKLVGISGGLACNNADEDDDIDFFLITAGGQVWTTRFLVTGALECLGVRRRPNDRYVKDAICVNMLIDEDHLTLPLKEQDLFGAHETILMKPIRQRDHMHDRFLAANRWAGTWLPNAGIPPYPPGNRNNRSIGFLRACEQMVKGAQLWYMDTRRTTESISEGRMRFHPHDARKQVTEEYRNILRRFGSI